jgi:hypothetical protein
MPAGNEEECRARLAQAEADLRRNAHEGERRWGWKSHVFNAALQAGGAAIVSETWGARRDAWSQAALGLAFGEAIIWSFPWQATDALEDYERRFPASGLPPEPQVSWGLAPNLGGGSFFVRF